MKYDKPMNHPTCGREWDLKPGGVPRLLSGFAKGRYPLLQPTGIKVAALL
jgi:hypothetical protein